MEPLSGDRKCFRLINGVLVERTVKDIVPALKTNQEGLRMVLDDLVKQYKTKQDDLEKWKVSHRPRPYPDFIIVVYGPNFRIEEEQCPGSSTMMWTT